MKHLKIVGRCFVNGEAVTPDAGVISCGDNEAAELIAAGLAEDVSEDFADPDADTPETPAPAAKPAKAK